MTWIASHPPAGFESLGLRVKLAKADAHGIGWVKFDRSEGLWRADCASSRCHELGQAYTRQGAADHVVQHYLLEHR